MQLKFLQFDFFEVDITLSLFEVHMAKILNNQLLTAVQCQLQKAKLFKLALMELWLTRPI